ncbi:hypothetical protein EJ06DRAFT_38601 [Trichodelitschia bisporula]|uniref:Uncharacterized protein n=1 Tax=Trichodelitschia bisporula TaxID=703511 RepID=A0A6G1HV16_9PEZI|nr:hypothetical protein EJ06DRAFT_38601 [Trichodelitschia bisporula]
MPGGAWAVWACRMLGSVGEVVGVCFALDCRWILRLDGCDGGAVGAMEGTECLVGVWTSLGPDPSADGTFREAARRAGVSRVAPQGSAGEVARGGFWISKDASWSWASLLLPYRSPSLAADESEREDNAGPAVVAWPNGNWKSYFGPCSGIVWMMQCHAWLRVLMGACFLCFATFDEVQRRKRENPWSCEA